MYIYIKKAHRSPSSYMYLIVGKADHFTFEKLLSQGGNLKSSVKCKNLRETQTIQNI